MKYLQKLIKQNWAYVIGVGGVGLGEGDKWVGRGGCCVNIVLMLKRIEQNKQKTK